MVPSRHNAPAEQPACVHGVWAAAPGSRARQVPWLWCCQGATKTMKTRGKGERRCAARHLPTCGVLEPGGTKHIVEAAAGTPPAEQPAVDSSHVMHRWRTLESLLPRLETLQLPC